MKRNPRITSLLIFIIILAALAVTVMQFTKDQVTTSTNESVTNNTGAYVINAGDCVIDLCGCTCKHQGDIKTGLMCGVNCAEHSNVTGCALVDGQCFNVIKGVVDTPLESGTTSTTSTLATTTTIAAKMCGGFAGLRCPEGYDCQIPQLGPDQSGICKLHPSCVTNTDCPSGQGCHDGACSLMVVLH